MNQDKIGTYIKQLREKNNLTQEQLAEKINISRQAISKWEVGKTLPDYASLEKLCEVFNVSITEILSASSETNSNKLLLSLFNKKLQLKKIIIFSILIIIILLLSFLIYYFYNQYNKVKIYTIYGYDENVKLYNGMLIETSDRLFFNLGVLEFENDKEYKSIIVLKKT